MRQWHAHSTGIILNGQYNTLQNSTIAFSSGDGVFLGGSFNTVQNCTIHDVDYEAGDEAGITTLGANESILYNTIYNAGRSGIVIRHTTASLILHNIIHNVGMQMTDLGGIYAWGTDGREPRSATTSSTIFTPADTARAASISTTARRITSSITTSTGMSISA